MANFPFKNATFTDYADVDFPVLNYGSVYYTKIGGKIMAVKPIAFGIFKDTSTKVQSSFVASITRKLLVLAADGQQYILDMCGRYLFRSSEGAVMHEKSTNSLIDYSHIKTKSLDEIFSSYGVYRDRQRLKMYMWAEKNGYAYDVNGGYVFWADCDGEHIIFVDQVDGKKVYLTKNACVNDNVRVVEFSDDTPIPMGKYTVTREFTVEASSEEEAEAIVTKKLENI